MLRNFSVVKFCVLDKELNVLFYRPGMYYDEGKKMLQILSEFVVRSNQEEKNENKNEEQLIPKDEVDRNNQNAESAIDLETVKKYVYVRGTGL